MAALLLGLGGALVFLALLRGYSMVRADPLGHLSDEDRSLLTREAERRRRVGLLTRFGRRIGPEIGALLGSPYRSWIERRVGFAHRSQFETSADFYEMKARLMLICGLGALGVGLLTRSAFLPVMLLTLGFVLPDLMLWSDGRRRQKEMEKALPDFLDVLAVTVSAGLSFRSALVRVTERTEGPLAEEMRTVMQQMDVGTSRYEAFKALRDRTESTAMDAFITSLLQSEELGSPLVEALDQIATDVRREAAQRARQDASKASPKIASVVTFVMVPGTLLLLLVCMYFISGLDFGELFGGGE